MPHWIRTSLVVLLLVPVAGCGMSRTQPPPASDVVSVESPASVAGLWKETPWRMSRLWSGGDTQVSIAPGGTYVAWSDRGPAPAINAGTLRVVDGKLVSDTPSLISIFTVVQSHGKPILVVEITGKDGDHSYVPLVRDAP